MQEVHISSNSENFFADLPLLPAYNFSATMTITYSTYRLGAVASLKLLAIENITPHFSAYVCYGKMAGWIRTPLGTKVCLGSGDSVLDGDPVHPSTQRGTAAPSHFYCARSLRIKCTRIFIVYV